MSQQQYDEITPHPFVARPNRTLLRLATPVLFSLVAEPLTGMADTAFVARLSGSAPVAALGVGTVAFSSIFWAFTFLGVGTQTAVAQAHGKGKHDESARIVSLACLLAVVCGVFMCFVATGILSPVAGLLGAEGRVNDLACDYMMYRLFGAPAVLVTLACFGGLRGVQDMRTPLVVAVGINLINVLLDWLLIFGVGSLPAMGVAGAAIASSISQWIGALACVWAVSRRIGLTANVDWAGLKRLLQVGGDLFIRTAAVLLFLGLCTRTANRFGADYGAAYQAIRQFFIFSALFLDAFAITGQSLVGYFLGGDNYKQARRVAKAVCCWSFGTGCILCVSMLLGEQGVIWLLVPPSAVVAFSPGWLVVALIQPMNSLSFATDGVHWGTGDFRYLRNCMLMASLVGGCGVLAVEMLRPEHPLVFIWLATALWTGVRAVTGLLRIWPGVGDAPLDRHVADAEVDSPRADKS